GLIIPGESKPYKDYTILEADYLSGRLEADTLKRVVIDCLNGRLDVIRADFKNLALKTLVEQAYPSSDISHLTAASRSGWLHSIWNSRFIQAIWSLLTNYLPLSTAETSNLTLHPSEITSGLTSGIPAKLAEVDSRMGPIQDKAGLLRVFEEEFPVKTSNLTLHPSEITSGLTSGIPAKLAEVDSRMGPIQDKAGLLRVFEEEFPGSGVQLSNRLKQTDQLRCLWSITPVGLPHLGHSIPIRRLARLSQFSGVHIIVLVNDVGAHLRSSVSWDLVRPRGEFCRTVITALFTAMGGREAQFTCLLGSEFQMAGDYMLEFYRLVSLVSELDCAFGSDCPMAESVDESVTVADLPDDSMHTGSGRFSLGQLLMPCTDLVDTAYLGAIVRVSSPERARKRSMFDQKYFTTFTTKTVPLYLDHVLLPSLQIDTRGASGENGTIGIHPMQACLPASRYHGPPSAQALAVQAEDCTLPLIEPPSVAAEKSALSGLKRRLKRAFCQPGNVTVNPVLDIYRYILLPELSPEAPLVILRSEKNGGPLHIQSPDGATDSVSRWKALVNSFASGTLHPGDLKPAVELALSSSTANSLSDRLSRTLPKWSELTKLLDAAFPLSNQAPSAKTKMKGKTTLANEGNTGANRVINQEGRLLKPRTCFTCIDDQRLAINKFQNEEDSAPTVK
ncbi:Tyrosyl-tRNA synthetase cytoplasmic, partial [Paragonimus westermani]